MWTNWWIRDCCIATTRNFAKTWGNDFKFIKQCEIIEKYTISSLKDNFWTYINSFNSDKLTSYTGTSYSLMVIRGGSSVFSLNSKKTYSSKNKYKTCLVIENMISIFF